ncbi:MAG: YkgJ family cysteine cluster protein [Chthoniobacter sp.]|uniref:YkgJ family cysteine cluster protein n=1 Tax=Chthoniobacter sp. TaxID=2510640 RepID=UPI0032A1C5D6
MVCGGGGGASAGIAAAGCGAMTAAEQASAASRLCAACGMCCNGVMFYIVRLQPKDSAKELSALGLKLKRKKGQNYIQQPCPAFRGSHCSIYAARPERCRVFACRQLQKVEAGEITEALALERIHEAQRRVAEVEELLEKAGRTSPKRALFKRYEKIMAVPVDAFSDPVTAELRGQLTRAMHELDVFLDEEFRVPAADAASVEGAGMLPPRHEDTKV